MNEKTYIKKGTQNLVSIHIYCFWKARDHPREKEEKKIWEIIDEAHARAHDADDFVGSEVDAENLEADWEEDESWQDEEEW